MYNCPAFYILQNRGVSYRAVRLVCKLVRDRVVAYALIFDHRWQPSCVVLTRFEEVVALHLLNRPFVLGCSRFVHSIS